MKYAEYDRKYDKKYAKVISFMQNSAGSIFCIFAISVIYMHSHFADGDSQSGSTVTQEESTLLSTWNRPSECCRSGGRVCFTQSLPLKTGTRNRGAVISKVGSAYIWPIWQICKIWTLRYFAYTKWLLHIFCHIFCHILHISCHIFCHIMHILPCILYTFVHILHI